MGRKKKSVADVMQESTFSFADLKKEPVTVAVVLPKSSTFNPFDVLSAEPTADMDAVADGMVVGPVPVFTFHGEFDKPKRKSKAKKPR